MQPRLTSAASIRLLRRRPRRVFGSPPSAAIGQVERPLVCRYTIFARRSTAAAAAVSSLHCLRRGHGRTRQGDGNRTRRGRPGDGRRRPADGQMDCEGRQAPTTDSRRQSRARDDADAQKSQPADFPSIEHAAAKQDACAGGWHNADVDDVQRRQVLPDAGVRGVLSIARIDSGRRQESVGSGVGSQSGRGSKLRDMSTCKRTNDVQRVFQWNFDRSSPLRRHGTLLKLFKLSTNAALEYWVLKVYPM